MLKIPTTYAENFSQLKLSLSSKFYSMIPAHLFFYCYNTSLRTWGVFYLLKTQKLKHVYPTTSQDGDKYSSTFPMLIVIEHKFTLLQNFCEHTVFLWPQKNYSTCHSWKKSFPLSSTTMNAGKFLTSTFQIASMPEKKSFDCYKDKMAF